MHVPSVAREGVSLAFVPPSNLSLAALSARAVPCVGAWAATQHDCISTVPADSPTNPLEFAVHPPLWRQPCAGASCLSYPRSPSPSPVHVSSMACEQVSLEHLRAKVRQYYERIAVVVQTSNAYELRRWMDECVRRGSGRAVARDSGG